MPANIIDALVTTLSLDNSDFIKGIKQSIEGSKKYREAAVDDAKRQQDAQKQIADGVRKIRNETLGLLLAMGGARSMGEFFNNIIQGDAATGRLASNLGIATEQLSAWEGAIGRVGGNAKSADAALQGMVSAVQDFKLTGNSKIAPDLMGLGVTQFDDPSKMLLQIADASQRMSKPEFAARASRLGFDNDTINLLEKGRSGVEQLLEEQRKLGVATDKDAEAAQAFESQMSKLASTIKGMARPEITNLAAGLTSTVQGMNDANATAPILIGTLSAVGIAAAAAAGPWIILASAIATAILAYERFSTASGRQRIKENAHGDKKALLDLFHGNFKDAWSDLANTDHSKSDAMADQSSSFSSAASSSDVAAYMRSQGFSAEQARGIAAGVSAEGGGLGFAANGAFGIGQWRGARQRALFRRYGNHPSREQQLAFLASELKGGDPGGAAVRGSTSAYGAMSAYITAFMRPGSGTAGDLQRGARFLGGKPMPVAAGGSGSSSVSIGHMTVVSNDPKSFARKDLASALKDRGLIIQAQRGVTP